MLCILSNSASINNLVAKISLLGKKNFLFFVSIHTDNYETRVFTEELNF